MPYVQFEGKTYLAETGESVLDALLRQGAELPSSCRSGVCQTCIMRAEPGMVDAKSQAGLKATLKEQGYFLPCICIPSVDMEVSRPGDGVVNRVTATLAAKERLNSEIVGL